MFDLTDCIKWAVSIINESVTKRILVEALTNVYNVLPEICCPWEFLQYINEQSWPLSSDLTLDIVWRMVKVGDTNLQRHVNDECLSVNTPLIINENVIMCITNFLTSTQVHNKQILQTMNQNINNEWQVVNIFLRSL